MRFAFRSEMTKRSQIMLTLQGFSHKHWLEIGRGIPERRYFSSPMSGNNRSSGQSRWSADARGPCGRPPQACDHDEITKQSQIVLYPREVLIFQHRKWAT